MMAFTEVSLTQEVRTIVGDLGDQFGVNSTMMKISDELKNTMYFLTSTENFFWNTQEASLNLSTGTTACPTGLVNVQYMVDNKGNGNYELATAEEYLLIKYNTEYAVTYDENSRVPYYISVGVTTGVETIQLCTFATTPSDLMVYMVYNEAVSSVTDPRIPERLRPFIVSFTAANLLAKLDNPDKELVQLHSAIAKATLDQEYAIHRRRKANKTHRNLYASPNMGLEVGGNYRS